MGQSIRYFQMHFLCLQCAHLVNLGLLNNSGTFYDLIPWCIKEKRVLKENIPLQHFKTKKEAISSLGRSNLSNKNGFKEKHM